MCGICGIWSREQSYISGSLQRDLQSAVSSLRHRGPDDSGMYVNDNGVGLGHTRLSILDLSSTGHQPMTSPDGRHTIVYNGEIYNYREIRKKLISRGHTFRGSGDTEVLLAAFVEWGQDALDLLVGMFSIALWDDVDKTLTLIRDRLGIKPLYYGWNGHSFWFGSEMRSMLQFSNWSPTINTQSLGEFLQYGYISAPRSIFDKVHKLPPGCHLTLKPRGEPKIERYWSATSFVNSPILLPDDEIEFELEELFANAFGYRMVSDVPVGVYLSGGVDSTLVTAILSESGNERLHTFTIGFAENTHDESRWAREVAAHLGTRHTEHILHQQEAMDVVKQWGDLFDEPFGDSSGIPTLLVSKLASNEVKVVLSADGGDELFSGYTVYDTVLRRRQELQRIPANLRHLTSASLKSIPVEWLMSTSSSSIMPVSARGRLKQRILRLREITFPVSLGKLQEVYSSHWLPEEIGRLIGNYESPRENADGFPGSDIDKLSLCDLAHYLPDDILTKVDRTTMAASIEGREPLLDHRIAEFAMRTPLHLRRGRLGPKHILKKILYEKVPRQLVDRPKQGFAIPLSSWLTHELQEVVDGYVGRAGQTVSGYFDPQVVHGLVTDFYKGNTLLTTRLWFLLAFEMWHDRWMKNDTGRDDSWRQAS